MATNTTIQAINNAVPNVGLDTPHPEEPTRKLLNAILRDYLQALESLENDTVTKSQIVQEFGDSQTAVISQDALTDYLSNLSFLQLADTPYVYAGSIGKFIRVNTSGDGLEFFELGAAAISNSFNDLSDKPDFDSIPQVVTAADFASLPATGDVTKTYLTLDDGKLYYWSGSAYVVFTNDTATWAGIGGNIGDNAALTSALNDKADAADAALKSTSIYAGAGLIGGGDLSTDRTLNVDIGTGAGQVMAGDDSRVTGLEDGAYAQIGVDVAPLGQDGLVPPAHLPAQFSGDYDDLTNKPALFSGAYDDLTGKPMLGTVAALAVDTDVNLAANSDALIPSQKAVKAYVDNNAGGGGLDPTADEPISGVWDLQNGVNIKGAKYGQPSSNPDFPDAVVEYAQTFSNTSSGGTIEIDCFRGLFDEGSSTLGVGAVNSVDTSTMANGDSVSYINYRMVDLVNEVYSYDYSAIEKDDNGLLGSSYGAVSSVGDNSVGFSFEADTNGSTAAITQSGSGYSIETPIDGRILTEEVTFSRALTKSDIGKILICTGSSDITLTVPVGLQDKTFNCVIQNKTDSNVVTIADDATSVIFNRHGEYDIALGGVASLLPTLETDEYTLVGETV